MSDSNNENINFYFRRKKTRHKHLQHRKRLEIFRNGKRHSPPQKFCNKKVSHRFTRVLHFYGNRVHRRLHRTLNRDNERRCPFIKTFSASSFQSLASQSANDPPRKK